MAPCREIRSVLKGREIVPICKRDRPNGPPLMLDSGRGPHSLYWRGPENCWALDLIVFSTNMGFSRVWIGASRIICDGESVTGFRHDVFDDQLFELFGENTFDLLSSTSETDEGGDFGEEFMACDSDVAADYCRKSFADFNWRQKLGFAQIGRRYVGSIANLNFRFECREKVVLCRQQPVASGVRNCFVDRRADF